MKYLKVAEVRNLLGQYQREEITFSRMVELMNEGVGEKIQKEIELLQWSNGSEWIDGDQLEKSILYKKKLQ